jgi:GT2 family glycosyltransferase
MGGSGNMAIRRDVFEQIGGFDERLGAGRAGCSEDTELFYRALARGAQCRYEPRSVTYHYHRRDMASLKQQLFLYMRGHVAASLVQHAKHNDRGNLRHLVWGLPKTYIGYGLRCFTTNPAFQLSLLRTEIAGCLAGWRFYWRHRVDTVGVQMLQGAPPEA